MLCPFKELPRSFVSGSLTAVATRLLNRKVECWIMTLPESVWRRYNAIVIASVYPYLYKISNTSLRWPTRDMLQIKRSVANKKRTLQTKKNNALQTKKETTANKKNKNCKEKREAAANLRWTLQIKENTYHVRATCVGGLCFCVPAKRAVCIRHVLFRPQLFKRWIALSTR